MAPLGGAANLKRFSAQRPSRIKTAPPVANRLQELREAQGLTLRDLAAKVGTSNQQISHLELGKRQLTTAWLNRIAQVLGCHPWEIVEGIGAAQLTQAEQRLVQNFRLMSEEQQSSLLADMSPRPKVAGVRKHRAG